MEEEGKEEGKEKGKKREEEGRGGGSYFKAVYLKAVRSSKRV